MQYRMSRQAREEFNTNHTKMLRAMLSRYELVWLYYNGLSYGAQKLKPFVNGSPRGFGEYGNSAFKKTYPSDEVIDKNVPSLGVD